jgi:Protein of unknown function (DUF2637)
MGGQFKRLIMALPLVVVVVAPAAASWLGLVTVGHEWFGLGGAWALLVPLVFDAAALYVATLSWRAVLAGDSALVDRLLVWAYGLGSAGLNVWFAGSTPAAVFFGAASVSAVVLWDRTLRARRRDALRTMGAIEGALPRFRVLRWVVAPAETARAWRVAIVEGITSPTEALTRSRQLTLSPRVQATAELSAPDGYDPEPTDPWDWPAAPAPLLGSVSDLERETERARQLVAAEESRADVVVEDQAVADADTVPWWSPFRIEVSGTDQPPAIEAARTGSDEVDAESDEHEREIAAELAGCESKRESLLVAWRELGVDGVPETTDVMPAVEWLAERGVRVDKSGAYELRRRLARKAAAVRPALTAVGGGR